jgi:hypothetical protein
VAIALLQLICGIHVGATGLLITSLENLVLSGRRLIGTLRPRERMVQ